MDAKLSEVIAGGVTELFTPVIVFGKSEDEFCGGDTGALFVEVADDEAEEIVEGVFGVGWSEAGFPFLHRFSVEWGELVEDFVDFCIVSDVIRDGDEVCGDECAFEVEGEPFPVRLEFLYGNMTCEFDIIRPSSVKPVHDL